MSIAHPRYRFFVVEDEALVLMLIEDILVELGHEVAAVASRLHDACELARSREFDLAILDVNLDGQPSYPVAEILAERGVRFAFATGYGAPGLRGKFSDVPTLAKPFTGADVEKMVAVMIESSIPGMG